MDFPIYLQALLLFLPAGAANMSPVLANKIPLLNQWKTPLDFEVEWKGQRVFGKNKTWRGLVVGTIVGTIVGWLVYRWFFSSYDTTTYIFASAAMSMGALLGDAGESFFKRQRNIPSGHAWFPFDQTDYIIGALLLALPFGIIELAMIPYIFGWYFGLHLMSSYVGYLLGLKERPI